MKILGIGHSHLFSLFSGYKVGNFPSLEFDFIQLLQPEFRLENGFDNIDTILGAVNKKSSNVDIVVLSISGNEHHMLGLVESERPFDFLLPGTEQGNIIRDRELLPYDLVYKTLDLQMNVALYKAFAGIFNCPVYQVEAPPPILDDAYIRNHAGIFSEAIEQRGVNAASVRHKLWRVGSTIARQRAVQAGFVYVENPAVALGPEGFLHFMAYNNDATHGNSWYGMHVINNLLAIIN
ncbi:hypothetical protein Sphch_2703 [Sphingobium chlorophenolicum L-1]|uniref:Uncharacterized protein n=1 Tax=Sphingobium chlorophenolicum L-1 TaxID=690566 RepID=F6F0M4_SPHCR|nr:hypothetical protein [Sphingobium chlorophenolicum]AEG50346.1 hypothetical protein Sphch_2703 [Sphingobium chlorophenolicum L-1]